MHKTQATDVLIAEDDALINEAIARQLVRLGYTPTGQAYDGAQAVEMACRSRPSIVLMDLQMIDPETGREDVAAGLKASRAIQERCPAAVVVLTAHESPDLVEQACEAGVSAYLVKPAADMELDRVLSIARARFEDLLKTRDAAQDLERENAAIRTTLAQTKSLSGVLPVCAWCRRIRDEDGAWEEIEVYIQQHSEATFSHGVCPECHRKMFPKDHPAGSA